MTFTTVKAATCEEAGEGLYVATFTKAPFTIQLKNVELPALGHKWTFVDFTWTETETGFTAVANFVCDNDASHTKTVEATVTSETTGAVCEAAGKIVYTAKVTFEEKDYTDTKEVAVEAIGHAYGEPTFEWTATETGYTVKATAVCANDPTHTLTVDATVEAVTTAATCEEAGKTVYTATAVIDGKTYTDTKEVEIPAMGHKWTFVDFTWTETETGYTAVANFKCGNDATHTKTVEATVTAETTAATCEAAGKTVYTAAATFEEKIYTDTKEVPSKRRPTPTRRKSRSRLWAMRTANPNTSGARTT